MFVVLVLVTGLVVFVVVVRQCQGWVKWFTADIRPVPSAGVLQCTDCGQHYTYSGQVAAAVAYHRGFDCSKVKL